MTTSPPETPGIGRGEQRIGGNIEADVFHGRHRPGAGKSRTDGDFQGDFFIGRPLAAPAQFGEDFKDFGGRRAGVTGAERHAGITRGQTQWLRCRSGVVV